MVSNKKEAILFSITFLSFFILIDLLIGLKDPGYGWAVFQKDLLKAVITTLLTVVLTYFLTKMFYKKGAKE